MQGASGAQPSERLSALSPLRLWVQSLHWTNDTYVKRVLPKVESHGFSGFLQVLWFLPQGMLTEWSPPTDPSTVAP
jgi:hypothetical protein